MESLTTMWDSSRSNFEHNLAVVIGINNYQNGIHKLSTAVNDAIALADLLETEYKYQQVLRLVISLGGGATPESLPPLPGNQIVVSYAPQLELLQKATLTITHAGVNTTLESLSNGVPMVAIPVANDQPGVAAPIAYTGVGEVVSLKELSVPKVRSAIVKVLTQESYQKRAIEMQGAIVRSGGVKKAADIIEQVILTGKPVLA